MDANESIRIGTRRSRLAMAQAREVAEAIAAACPGVRPELVPLATRGDSWSGPLAGAGGKGLFTAELEAALRDGRIDLAVHSAKDLPAGLPEDLVIAAVPAREDPRDALVSAGGGPIDSLPAGAAVGTSSLRRAAQLLAVRPDLRIVPVRGNVETRLAKALGPREAGLDAVVLAMAGLRRAGLLAEHARRVCPLDVEQFIPAAGQGALAVQCLASSAPAAERAARITDPDSTQALLAERQVVHGLGADCRSCLAVHVAPRSAPGPFTDAGSAWRAWGLAARPGGTGRLLRLAEGPSASAAADALLEALLRAGARELLADRRDPGQTPRPVIDYPPSPG